MRRRRNKIIDKETQRIIDQLMNKYKEKQKPKVKNVEKQYNLEQKEIGDRVTVIISGAVDLINREFKTEEDFRIESLEARRCNDNKFFVVVNKSKDNLRLTIANPDTRKLYSVPMNCVKIKEL